MLFSFKTKQHGVVAGKCSSGTFCLASVSALLAPSDFDKWLHCESRCWGKVFFLLWIKLLLGSHTIRPTNLTQGRRYITLTTAKHLLHISYPEKIVCPTTMLQGFLRCIVTWVVLAGLFWGEALVLMDVQMVSQTTWRREGVRCDSGCQSYSVRTLKISHIELLKNWFFFMWNVTFRKKRDMKKPS